MPATKNVTINCPACAEPIPLPINLVSAGKNDAGDLVIELVPDMEPAEAHRCAYESIVTV